MLEAFVQQRDPQAFEAHQANAPELLLDAVRLMKEDEVTEGPFGIALDFDQNISHGGPSKGLDPRDSYLDPIVKQSLIDIRDAGHPVVIISSRGARDVAEKVGIPGISYVGTLGWETYVVNDQDPSQGISLIHPQFEPFKSKITGILGDVRQRFFKEQLGISAEITDDPNLELSTPEGGKVILQRKGYNPDYPEGINLTWALNLVSDEVGPDGISDRVKYRNALETYYNEAYEKHAEGLVDEEKATLKELCGLKSRPGMSNEGLPTLDIEMRPTSQSAKAGAMIQLLRPTDDPNRLWHFGHMPHSTRWVYSGDHIEQDGAVMLAGHRLNRINSNAGVIGIWSRPPHEEDRVIPSYVDVVVPAVAGNASLHRDIAAIVKK